MKPFSLFSSWAVLVILTACNAGVASNGDKKDNTSSSASSSIGGSSGADMYYEYQITTTIASKATPSDMKLYLAQNGNLRMEMDINIAGMPKPTHMVIIGSEAKPNESITIDDDAKTYTKNVVDSNDLKSPMDVTSTVTKIGEEKVNGFNCVHARIFSKTSMGNFYNSTDTIDLWRSNDVPVQAEFKGWMDKFEAKTGNTMYSTEAVTQLKQMGCDGFVVKLQRSGDKSGYQQNLVKAEHRDLPASLFQIPAGYKEEKE